MKIIPPSHTFLSEPDGTRFQEKRFEKPPIQRYDEEGKIFRRSGQQNPPEFRLNHMGRLQYAPVVSAAALFLV